MFEIRVICDLTDSIRIVRALSETFTTSPIRQRPARDGKRTRLYITADHRPAAEPWPNPETAYALAPSIIREIGWTADQVAHKPFSTTLGREFWLRKAAVLDRIALADEADGIHSDASEVATEAARRLIEHDRDGEGDYYGTPYWPDHTATAANPRGYVRQEYAHWAKHR